MQAPPSLADSAASLAEQNGNGHAEEHQDDGFQPAGRPSRPRNSSHGGGAAAAARAPLLAQAEAAKLLETAAQTVSGGDCLRLWQEWARQVRPASASPHAAPVVHLAE